MKALKLGNRLRRAIAVAATATVLLLALTACVHRPDPGFTFVQICDPQLGFGGYDEDLARFKQAVNRVNDLHPDFVVICGDLVNAASEKTFADFNQAKQGFLVPCHCAPGNHDLGNKPTPETLARYRRCVGKDYYSFAHKGSLFVVVNSQLWVSPVPGESEKQDVWLKQTLASAGRNTRPIFIIDHYPLFEKQPLEEDAYFNVPKAKRQELLDLFHQSGVVAVLSGHTHKVIVNEFDGMQLVASQTTSKNFDKEPCGFRLWHVDQTRPYKSEVVELK